MYLPFESAPGLVQQLLDVKSKQTPWLLCISDQHAEALSSLFEAAKQNDLRICGGLFPGLIDGAQRRDTGVIAIPLPDGSQIIPASVNREGIKWFDQLPVIPDNTPTSMLLFVDCLSTGIARYLEEIYDRYGTSVQYAGAGAGYRDLRSSPSIFTDSGFLPSGGLLIIMPITATSSVRHGWKRVAGPFIATRTRDNLLQEINWEPAGTFYRGLVESLAPELKEKSVFPDLSSRFPLCIARQSAEDVVRVPVDINEDDEIAMLSDFSENSAIYLLEANPQTLIGAAREAIRDCSTSEEIDTCLVLDCFTRSLILDQDYGRELEAVLEELEGFSDQPLQGVLALGEIFGDRRSSLEFYNKTFVFSAIHRSGQEVEIR
jgi:hypothetical protein